MRNIAKHENKKEYFVSLYFEKKNVKIERNHLFKLLERISEKRKKRTKKTSWNQNYLAKRITWLNSKQTFNVYKLTP